MISLMMDQIQSMLVARVHKLNYLGVRCGKLNTQLGYSGYFAYLADKSDITYSTCPKSTFCKALYPFKLPE